MDRSCQRALELGLPAIAFTEHADFTDYVKAHRMALDLRGYHAAIADCRARYPQLRILSGVELGEPHRFPAEAATVLKAGPLDRVVGSVHCIVFNDVLTDTSQGGLLTPSTAPLIQRLYLEETLALLQSSQQFEILAHLDYPQRYWPHGQLVYDESVFEDQYRAVLRTAAQRGIALEINTKAGDPDRGVHLYTRLLRWWRAEGGEAVSFGSDAHEPRYVAHQFTRSSQLVEAAGFRPAEDPTDYWRI
jgi:histidinol-phosphatase (PHP family)